MNYETMTSNTGALLSGLIHISKDDMDLSSKDASTNYYSGDWRPHATVHCLASLLNTQQHGIERVESMHTYTTTWYPR